MPSGSPMSVPPLLSAADPSPLRDASDTKRSSAARPAAPADETDWSALMMRAQDGDRDAYRHLLEAMVPYLRSLAFRHHRNPSDVEDAVQDILLTMHAIRHSYDPTRPFGPWLVAIARRRIVDRLRRQGRSTSLEVTLDVTHETFVAPDTNIREAAWNERTLRRAVERLPAGQRQAVTLLKLREMSLKEAAMTSGQSVPALKVALHRALKNLRKALGSRRGET